MDRAQLTPVAEILVSAYLDTASHSYAFRDDYGLPLTTAAQVHYMRSFAQARITQDARYTLSASYSEFGRIQIRDGETGVSYLLRSQSAVTIERDTTQKDSLFNAAKYLSSPVVMLVYNFRQEGLDISVAGARQLIGRARLEVSGAPTYIGTWPLTFSEPEPFNQHQVDPFEELGRLDEMDEGGESDAS